MCTDVFLRVYLCTTYVQLLCSPEKGQDLSGLELPMAGSQYVGAQN